MRTKKIIDINRNGSERAYDVVTEWPAGGYSVWAIGRHNFLHPGFLPLAQASDVPYHIKPDTLKALYVGNEALCLAALDEAIEHGCDEAKFNQIASRFAEK